ncbi:glycoside hydrolase family 3 protein [Alginatibacterium sediminis]|uniref:Glycoside hydrolase family 3 protein n=1 Tax=Alginatibacterium sediminis TaxID=2164068 RepID=A0A420EHY0_9ALTE|nr:glycoside hydrolase family 3 protein [Alginatibacterium sediminis]RKF20267.1 glycoside hydrolase family 3 protein [Alginatibacterium sediminis]
MSQKFHLPYFPQWPEIQSSIPKDPEIETKITNILDCMTLEEKVGQMIQPNLRAVTPKLAHEYKLGSILNGGGAWPNDDKYATAQDWVDAATQYWNAIEDAFSDRSFRIPFMWATDAVHGHNNVFGATVFPHNIGLGAARDPQLIFEIGEATAREIVATGLDWTFAPTVAIPRDLRWGRVYEGYSENPEITYAYAEQMVKGLQGDASSLKTDQKVISNVKHWLGDGGTLQGVDRGINNYSEDMLRNIHAAGYFSGLSAGAQVVMSSFNSWNNNTNYDHSPQLDGEYNYKIHGSRYLLNDVLKQQMGFDGLVVTDWNGHAEVTRCSDQDACYAINAGNDILMIPGQEDWQAVYHKTIADVKNGHILMSRIDDAVLRILRVKMRAGLWKKSAPNQRSCAANQSLLGATKHRELARQAVRKSLVLLKNNNDILPLDRNTNILLTGSAADDLQKQAGGWNLTWQGDENQLSDFPGATTLKMALEAELGCERVSYDPLLEHDHSEIDTAVVVFGEDPYAEMMGDIKDWQSLDFGALKRSYRLDLDKIHRLKALGKKVICVFFSGRPLYLNAEISAADAFVAAWLPGSEGAGMTDVFLRDGSGNIQFDFQAKLSFSWPNRKDSTHVSQILSHIPNYEVPEHEQDPRGEHAPLFDYGYGLSYNEGSGKHRFDLNNLPLDLTKDENQHQIASHNLCMFGREAIVGDYHLRIADVENWDGSEVSRNNQIALTHISATPVNYQHQQDGVLVTFGDQLASLYVETQAGIPEDFSPYIKAEADLVFDILVEQLAPQFLQVGCVKSPQAVKSLGLDISATLRQFEPNTWQTMRFNLGRLESLGVDVANLSTPLVFQSNGPWQIRIGNIRFEIKA